MGNVSCCGHRNQFYFCELACGLEGLFKNIVCRAGNKNLMEFLYRRGLERGQHPFLKSTSQFNDETMAVCDLVRDRSTFISVPSRCLESSPSKTDTLNVNIEL